MGVFHRFRAGHCEPSGRDFSQGPKSIDPRARASDTIAAMPSLRLREIEKRFGEQPILRGIDLDVAEGEFAVLVGPSGCGKSTLLRTVAGLEIPDHGTVHLGERDVTHAAPRDRDLAMVFQSYALYPHLTVRDNLAFGLRMRKTDAATIGARITDVSAMLELGSLLDRYPRQLSGGQRQRVAMGRAIARRPSLLLFDEPLSNLDAALRGQVRVEIKKLHQQLGTTMVYVTHDQVEAMTLADRLVVLNAGRVEQQGTPLAIYERPVSRFVAGFLGSPAMNFLDATVRADRVIACDGLDGRMSSQARAAPADGQRIVVGIRPHDVLSANETDATGMDGGPPESVKLALQVDVVEAMGFETFAHGRIGSQSFVARLGGSAPAPRPGTRLDLRAPLASVHFFAADTGRAIDGG